MLLSSNVMAEELSKAEKRWAEKDKHIVNAAFLEMRTGPGRGYPIVHTLKRGEAFIMLRRKTSWFKVTSIDGREGWLNEKQVEKSRIDGKLIKVKHLGKEDYSERKFEIGFSSGEARGGNNNGTPLLSLYSAYSFTGNIAVELTASQVLGRFSDSVSGQLNITHAFAPEWVVSPFFSLGIGSIATDPKVALGETKKVENDALNWGVGAKYYLGNRFFLRFDYNKYLLLTERNEIGKVESWKIGVGAFF